MSYQLTILQGNLTRDPKLKAVGQSQVTEFGIAVSRKFKDKSGKYIEEVDFWDVEIWGNQATACAEHLKKGSSALAQGTLRKQEWQDANTGAPKSKFVLNADKVVFLGGKKTDADEQAPMPFGKANQGMSKMDPSTGQGELELSGMGLPF